MDGTTGTAVPETGARPTAQTCLRTPPPHGVDTTSTPDVGRRTPHRHDAAWPDDLLERQQWDSTPVVIRLPGRGVPYPPMLRTLADRGQLIRICRPSRWGSPYPLAPGAGLTERAESIAAYAAWLVGRPELQEQLGTLRGRVLGCRCWPLPCHGDVLAALAGRPADHEVGCGYCGTVRMCLCLRTEDHSMTTCQRCLPLLGASR